MLPLPPAFRWYPADEDLFTPWTHASGWRQFDGAARKISCVVPCRNQRRHLALLLPQVRDTLTESGYDWEVLIVDAASDDGSSSVLLHWSLEPGFRVARSRTPVHRTEAIVAGLQACRSDGVIVMDANARHAMALLRKAIARWDGGSRIVVATHEGGDRLMTVEPAAEAGGRLPREMIDTFDFGEAVGGFLLLDRCVVSSLLGAPPG